MCFFIESAWEEELQLTTGISCESEEIEAVERGIKVEDGSFYDGVWLVIDEGWAEDIVDMSEEVIIGDKLWLVDFGDSWKSIGHCDVFGLFD